MRVPSSFGCPLRSARNFVPRKPNEAFLRVDGLAKKRKKDKLMSGSISHGADRPGSGFINWQPRFLYANRACNHGCTFVEPVACTRTHVQLCAGQGVPVKVLNISNHWVDLLQSGRSFLAPAASFRDDDTLRAFLTSPRASDFSKMRPISPMNFVKLRGVRVTDLEIRSTPVSKLLGTIGTGIKVFVAEVFF